MHIMRITYCGQGEIVIAAWHPSHIHISSIYDRPTYRHVHSLIDVRSSSAPHVCYSCKGTHTHTHIDWGDPQTLSIDRKQQCCLMIHIDRRSVSFTLACLLLVNDRQMKIWQDDNNYWTTFIPNIDIANNQNVLHPPSLWLRQTITHTHEANNTIVKNNIKLWPRMIYIICVANFT